MLLFGVLEPDVLVRGCAAGCAPTWCCSWRCAALVCATRSRAPPFLPGTSGRHELTPSLPCSLIHVCRWTEFIPGIQRFWHHIAGQVRQLALPLMSSPSHSLAPLPVHVLARPLRHVPQAAP